MYSWINKELSWGNYTPPVRISARLMAQETRQENGLKMLWTDLTSLIPTEARGIFCYNAEEKKEFCSENS